MAVAPRLVKAKVSPRRSVITGGVDKTEKDAIIRVWTKTHGPGEELELPEDEVARLRAHGALETPGKPVVEPSAGDTKTVKAG